MKPSCIAVCKQRESRRWELLRQCQDLLGRPGSTRIAIPVAHIEKLLTLGYIEESLAGPKVTDLGALILEWEARKKGVPE